MKIAALGYVGVNAIQPKAWITFATEILGLRLGSEADDGSLGFQMDERAYRIAVHPANKDGLAYIGWEIPTPGDFEEALGEIEAAGLRPKLGTAEECASRRVARLFRISDPAGISLELFYGQLNTCEAFLPSRPISGFVTGHLGLGHVVISVADLGPCQKFYSEVMGFRLSDFVPNRLVVFHCNARHHSIAIGNLPTLGLRHIMLEVNTIDDVGKTFDLCKEKEVPITKTLGRHSNDLTFSFYMRSPSGFEIEYGTQGRLIDDATWTVQQLERGSFWGHQPTEER